MSSRTFFDQRNTIPGLIFIITILVFSLPEIFILIMADKLPKMDAFLGFLISTFTLLSGAPIGLLISQIWHFIWWVLYEWFFIRMNIIPFKEFKEEFNFNSEPRKLHTLYNYLTGVGINKKLNDITSYTGRRWDVINILAPSILSICLGRYFSLTYLKEGIISNYNLTYVNDFNATILYTYNNAYINNFTLYSYILMFMMLVGIFRLLHHNYNMVIFSLRQHRSGLPKKKICRIDDFIPNIYFKKEEICVVKNDDKSEENNIKKKD